MSDGMRTITLKMHEDYLERWMAWGKFQRFDPIDPERPEMGYLFRAVDNVEGVTQKHDDEWLPRLREHARSRGLMNDLPGVEFRAEDAPYRAYSHWAIRLRRRLLRKGTHRTNNWVRRITAWLEIHT